MNFDEKNEMVWEGMTPEQKKQAQKDEAVARMQTVGYFKPSIREFEKHGRVMLNELPVGAHFYIEDERDGALKHEVDVFEKNYNATVYAVTHTFFNFGECYEFFYVSNYPEEWEYDRAELADGYQCVYVWNCTYEQCSEFGTICFAKTMAGGLKRTA